MSDSASDSDSESDQFWLSLSWRAGPDRPLVQAESLLQPFYAWVKEKIPQSNQNQVPQMNLGEPNSFYWSTEIGGHVERGKEDEYRSRLSKTPLPPPKAQTLTGSTVTAPVRSRGRQYLDAQGQKITASSVSSPIVPILVSAPSPIVPVPEPILHQVQRPFSLSDPIVLCTYDWEAALSVFEESVQVNWLTE